MSGRTLEARITSPGEVDVSITMTLTVAQWDRVVESMGDHYLASDIRRALADIKRTATLWRNDTAVIAALATTEAPDA